MERLREQLFFPRLCPLRPQLSLSHMLRNGHESVKTESIKEETELFTCMIHCFNDVDSCLSVRCAKTSHHLNCKYFDNYHLHYFSTKYMGA